MQLSLTFTVEINWTHSTNDLQQMTTQVFCLEMAGECIETVQECIETDQSYWYGIGTVFAQTVFNKYSIWNHMHL